MSAPSYGSSSVGSVSAYSGSAATGIFSHEICICLLNQLEDRASSWLEGLYNASSLTNKETGDKPANDKIQTMFNEGLSMVNKWTPATLKKEIEALTHNCPNIRDIYRAVVEIYVASYFQLYPRLEYEISVPSLSIFIHCYYRFLARDPSVQTMNIFQMYGEHRRFIYAGATRNALYHILKRPMQEIFSSLENLEKQQETQDLRRQRATPSEHAVEPPTLINPNHMFQQVVQNYVQDVSTPAQHVPISAQKKDSKTPKASASSATPSKTPSTRNKGSSSKRNQTESKQKQSVNHRSKEIQTANEPIIPQSVPMLPSQKSAGGGSNSSAVSHRTIELPTPDKSKKHKKRRNTRNDSDDSYDSSDISSNEITSSNSSGSDSESGSENSSEEESKSSRSRRKDRDRKDDHKENRSHDHHHRSRRR